MDVISLNAKLIESIATVTGILAGFSLATAVGLINVKVWVTETKGKKEKLFELAIGTLLCTTLLLSGVFVSFAILSNRAVFYAGMAPQNQKIFNFYINLSLFLFALGIISLFAGTSLTGWIHGKALGITVTTLAVISLIWMIIIFFLAP